MRPRAATDHVVLDDQRGAAPGGGGSRQPGQAGERIARDPELRLQHARDAAWRALNRRDRTVLEMRRHLEDKRIEPALIGQVVEELSEQRYLDDARYAKLFAEDRRRLNAWGSDRIERRLRTLGVDAEHIEAALAEQSADDELAAAVALLQRRFPEPPTNTRDRDRALGMLVRRGYDWELSLDALRRYAGWGEYE